MWHIFCCGTRGTNASSSRIFETPAKCQECVRLRFCISHFAFAFSIRVFCLRFRFAEGAVRVFERRLKDPVFFFTMTWRYVSHLGRSEEDWRFERWSGKDPMYLSRPFLETLGGCTQRNARGGGWVAEACGVIERQILLFFSSLC